MAIIGTRQEFITKISSSTSFAITKYQLNPGQQATFPWLSDLVQNFEYYGFRNLRFIYRALSADALNSTNTALGVVMMGCIYDSADATFGSAAEMYNYQGTISAKPSQNMVYNVGNLAPRRYIRPGAQPANTDIRLYDIGNFFIATEGSQAAAVVGELWVEYEIFLTVPKLIGDLGTDAMVAHIKSTSGPVSTSAPLGSAYSVGYDNIGLTFSVGGATMNFPKSPGTVNNQIYKITWLFQGSGGTGSIGAQTLNGLTAVNYMYNGASPATVVGGGGYMVAMFFVKVSASNASDVPSIGFNFTGLPTTPTNAELFVELITPTGS